MFDIWCGFRVKGGVRDHVVLAIMGFEVSVASIGNKDIYAFKFSRDNAGFGVSNFIVKIFETVHPDSNPSIRSAAV